MKDILLCLFEAIIFLFFIVVLLPFMIVAFIVSFLCLIFTDGEEKCIKE